MLYHKHHLCGLESIKASKMEKEWKDGYGGLKKLTGDFPSGLVVKNLPSNAGDTGLICGWGTKIPQAAEQLSLLTTTTEPKSSSILLPQLESLCTTMKIPGDTSKTRPSEINKY